MTVLSIQEAEDKLECCREAYRTGDYWVCRYRVQTLLAAGVEAVEQRAEGLYLLGCLDEIDGKPGEALSKWVEARQSRPAPGANGHHDVYAVIEQAIRGLSAAPRVFISYASTDRELAQDIRNRLEQFPSISCIDYDRDFPSAGAVSESIAAAFALATAVLIVWSRAYSERVACVAEVREALFAQSFAASGHTILFVRADDYELPSDLKDRVWLDVAQYSRKELVGRIARTVCDGSTVTVRKPR